MFSHENLVANVMQYLAPLDYQPGDSVLHVAPLFHIGAGINSLIFTAVGGSHYFLPRFDAAEVLQYLEQKQTNRVFLVPTMITQLLRHLDIDNYPLSHLKSITYGASPMPETTIVAVRKRWPHVKCIQAYGQTESAPCLTLLLDDQHAEHLQSAGQPLIGVDLSIRDENDRALGPGEVGEICARGPNIMLGYWRNEGATATALKNGWLHTGDGGYLDEHGYLYVVDRLKYMIVSGGENVYSPEVEAVLLSHPRVVECAVIAIPSTQWGEAVTLWFASNLQ